MNTRRSRGAGGLAAVVLAVVLSAPARAADERFTLARAVPSDVFLYIAAQHNPERAFLDRYWGEVCEALEQSGIGQDAFGLLGSLLGEEEMAEVERIKERATQLLAGVDWEQLAGRETVFAERLPQPVQVNGGRVSMGPPDMVFIFRGSGDGAAQNFAGLAAILAGIVDEINAAAGVDALVVEESTRAGAQVASTNLFRMLPGAPPLPLAVAQRDDLVLIVLGEQMLNDVLGLLEGSSSKTALADDPRFRAAFAQLPAAEDGMVFFDVQSMLRPIRAVVEMAVSAIGSPRDTYNNTGMSPEANRLNAQALAAYSRGDIAQALAFTKQAHDAAPEDSIVLYNLACFQALLGNKDEALGWLDKAVAAGFYAPGKIASDADLESLRDEPRYKAALAQAAELAARRYAEDIVTNSSKKGEAYKLYMQAWQAYEEKDYERGMELMEQAYDVAPQDSRVLYGLACFHALLGHKEKALDLLERAADGGFYCPNHMSKDPDLESLRDDERYEAAVARARQKAAQLGAQRAAKEAGVWKQLVERLMNAAGIFDYIAEVETTDGYAVRTESILALVPDAKSNPVYPVFGKRRQLTGFDRYLPQETLSFSVSGGFDLGEFYKFIEDSIRMAGESGEGLLAKWEKLQQGLGVDVRKDILAWIDGDCVTVTLEGDRGSVWLIKVTDEEIAREKVGRAIEFLSTKLSELAAQNPPLAMLAVQTSPVEHEQLEGFQNLQFIMSPRPIVWGVADHQLIFGTSPDAVALCLATARGEHPSIRANARAMSEALVPDGPFTSVSLTDQRGLGDELAEMIGVVSMVSGMLTMAIPDPEVRPVVAKIAGMLAKLAPVVKRIDFYKSTATHATFDGRAWRTRMVTHYVSPEERGAGGASR